MKRHKRKKTTKHLTNINYRINRQIRVPEVRLIDHNGDNVGVVSTHEARDMAEKAELDLVEVAPNARPPVCRIMDYGKFSYEKTKKEREARKHQKQIELKSVRLTPRTSPFHREIGVRKAREWLQEGKKVKFMVKFKSRERDYPEIAQSTLEGIAEELKEIAEVEQKPKMDGWTMTLMLTPIGGA